MSEKKELNNFQNQSGLRKSLIELSKYHFDSTEMITPTKKLTFFQVLKNNVRCAFCKEKDCPARWSYCLCGMACT